MVHVRLIEKKSQILKAYACFKYFPIRTDNKALRYSLWNFPLVQFRCNILDPSLDCIRSRVMFYGMTG